MTLAADLLALQKIDIDLEARRGTLALVEARATEADGLDQQRLSLAEARGALRDLELTERALETKDEDLSSHLVEMDKKLYSGAVKNPKELNDLNNDVAMLKRQRAELDERVLVLMEQVDNARRREREADEALKQGQDNWEALRARSILQAQTTRAEIELLENDRKNALTRLDQESLDRYEDLRQRRRPAVATVDRGVCSGCRVEVPNHLIKKARIADRLASCSSCNRILFVA